MKIGVCMKVTPDTDTRIKINASADGIDPAGVKWIVSPYDMFAVEEAIRTKEAHGGEVVIFSVSNDSAIAQLRGGGLALGADRATLINDPAALASDSLGVARALAAAITRDECSLVFCGKQAIDDDNVQVPAMMAELLGWAQVSFVNEFETDGSTFKASRSVGSGTIEVVTGDLPVVITADKGLNTPRYAKLPAIMKAKKKPIEKLSLADLGLEAADVAPAVLVSDYGLPPGRPKGRILEGEVDEQVSELVRLLREEAKVI
jgi:electron transfer flavoprotein beta subunit